jgi:hypothetical protein
MLTADLRGRFLPEVGSDVDNATDQPGNGRAHSGHGLDHSIDCTVGTQRDLAGRVASPLMHHEELRAVFRVRAQAVGGHFQKRRRVPSCVKRHDQQGVRQAVLAGRHSVWRKQRPNRGLDRGRKRLSLDDSKGRFASICAAHVREHILGEGCVIPGVHQRDEPAATQRD